MRIRRPYIQLQDFNEDQTVGSNDRIIGQEQTPPYLTKNFTVDSIRSQILGVGNPGDVIVNNGDGTVGWDSNGYDPKMSIGINVYSDVYHQWVLGIYQGRVGGGIDIVASNSSGLIVEEVPTGDPVIVRPYLSSNVASYPNPGQDGRIEIWHDSTLLETRTFLSTDDMSSSTQSNFTYTDIAYGSALVSKVYLSSFSRLEIGVRVRASVGKNVGWGLLEGAGPSSYASATVVPPAIFALSSTREDHASSIPVRPVRFTPDNSTAGSGYIEYLKNNVRVGYVSFNSGDVFADDDATNDFTWTGVNPGDVLYMHVFENASPFTVGTTTTTAAPTTTTTTLAGTTTTTTLAGTTTTSTTTAAPTTTTTTAAPTTTTSTTTTSTSTTTTSTSTTTTTTVAFITDAVALHSVELTQVNKLFYTAPTSGFTSTANLNNGYEGGALKTLNSSSVTIAPWFSAVDPAPPPYNGRVEFWLNDVLKNTNNFTTSDNYSIQNRSNNAYTYTGVTNYDTILVKYFVGTSSNVSFNVGYVSPYGTQTNSWNVWEISGFTSNSVNSVTTNTLDGYSFAHEASEKTLSSSTVVLRPAKAYHNGNLVNVTSDDGRIEYYKNNTLISTVNFSAGDTFDSNTTANNFTYTGVTAGDDLTVIIYEG